MDLTFRSACFSLVGLVGFWALGCGSSTGSPYQPDQKSDAGHPDVTAGDANADAQKPPPMSGGGNVLLFAGTSQLLSSGPPCTGEAGATGDRWCAFISQSKTTLGNIDLFVVNVSRAAAGTNITCGSPIGDPNCLRLTGGFFEESAPPVSHAAFFRGDTLVYFDLTGAPYGWRPGMANGRMLAANVTPGDVHDCLPATKGTGLLCLQGPLDGTVIQSDLLVGRLDAVASPPLVKVATVISSNPADGNTPRFGVAFPTPSGDTVAWSSRATPSGPEILKTQELDDATTLRTVASDVTQWTVSPDGGQWYWLSQLVTTATSETGTLQTAPFVDATSPTTLVSRVVDYRVAATGGIVSLTAPGVLQGIVDPVGAPTAIVALDTGVVGMLRVSGQGHVAYTKGFDSILGLIDLYVRKLDGTGTRCMLTAQRNALIYSSFPPGSGAILWARVDLNAPLGDPPDGLFTSLSDCRTMTAATGVQRLGLSGDNGVLFTDQGDSADATLRLQNVLGGSALDPNPPTLIETRVDGFFALFPTPNAVLFTVNAGSVDDGLYLHPIAAP